MSSSIIPKEKLSAYQRWELDSFEPRAPINLPTAEQIERIHATARDEGYACGFEEGRLEARQQVKRLETLATGFQDALRDVEGEVSREILALALQVAKQVLMQAINVKPEVILAVVREAMQSLPHFGEAVKLHLDAEDAQLVRAHLGEQIEAIGWRTVVDEQVERGGCRITSVSTQIDATLATRWKRIVATLGESEAWLE